MSRARELAKAGGVQQRIAGFSSHVGMSTFLAAVHMENNLTVDGNANVGGNLTVTGTTTFNGGTLTLGDANTDNIVFGGEVDSNIIPDDDNSFDLGSSSKEWKDLYIDGTAHVDTLDVDENAGIIGNLTLTGNGDFNGDLDVDGTTNLDVVDIDGAVDMATTLTLAGNADFNGDLDVDGTTNLDVVDIDGAVDMASNLVIAGNIDANGNLDVDGTTDLDATNVVGTLTVTGDIAADNVTINGNTVSTSSGNLTIDSSGGTTTVSDNLTVSGTVTLNTALASSNLATSGVSAGTVGSSTAIPIITVNDKGLITSTSSTAVDSTTIEQGSASVAVANNGPITSTGNHDFTAGIDVTGNSTFANNVTITGSVDANGGASIDNVQIGVTNDNEIDTSSGNLVIDSAGGTTTVDDNLTVSGNLTVNGTTTTINSTTVAIDDKNFQVATGAADDAAADGAGLTVDSGDGDKTFNFEATGDNWGASENLNLASGKAYKINNASILNATTLGSSVVASSLTSVGTIATGVWQGTAINDTYLGTIDNANKVSLSALNIDGGTDIGAALVDADEIIVDDGGGGTNRRSDMSRVKTYIYGATSGDATASSAGAITLAASGVSAGTVGSSTAIPIITVDAKGRVTNTSTTAIDSTTIENGTASVAVASNGPITSTGNHDFTAGIDVTGNITVSGTVDGRDVASDGSKLDGIESSATADQTASEILTLIKTVDGSGSGLDADTLDGISSASFLRSDTSDTFSGTLTVSGNILPNANGTRDLGASGTRWANVYSSDLDLSNQAKGANSVDGTWGSYLIEEGEDHLFLTNRRNGKKFRFVLEEV